MISTQFQHEFRKEKLHFNFQVEPAYEGLPVRSVMADMPRVGMSSGAIEHVSKPFLAL